MMPWKLYADAAAYIFTWLIGYSSLMGAIGGDPDRGLLGAATSRAVAGGSVQAGRTLRLSRRRQPGAIIALVLAVLPVVPGFVRAAADARRQVANPTFLDSLYTYAWFVTFGLRASRCIWCSLRRLAGFRLMRA